MIYIFSILSFIILNNLIVKRAGAGRKDRLDKEREVARRRMTNLSGIQQQESADQRGQGDKGQDSEIPRFPLGPI